VIFTDLPAGSCTMAARRLAKARGTITVVTGANLPMVLDFLLTERDGASGAARSAEKGRDAVLVFAAEQVPVTEDKSHGG
jgi:PTS system N-acetylgalactosamine-specific IIA component